MEDFAQNPKFWLISFAVYAPLVALSAYLLRRQYGSTIGQLMSFVAIMFIGFVVVMVADMFGGAGIALG